jgi:hypothetical protein
MTWVKPPTMLLQANCGEPANGMCLSEPDQSTLTSCPDITLAGRDVTELGPNAEGVRSLDH